MENSNDFKTSQIHVKNVISPWKVKTFDKGNYLIKTISNFLSSEYQNNLFENMTSNDFSFYFVDKFYYSCHSITLKRSGW